MNLFKSSLSLAVAAGLCVSTSSCLKDDEPDYADWKSANENYVSEAVAQLAPDNSPLYDKIIPSWAPQTFALIRWHNDKSLFIKNPSPIDNSTVNIKYEVLDIDGNVINSSYDLHIDGDSIYQTRPCDMIVGVRAVLPHMHPGDSVSLVLPYSAAYGTAQHGSIKPFSTLLFRLKLVSVPNYLTE